MTDDNLKAQILAFADHVGNEGHAEAEAKSRGWLDDDGEPTEEGREVIKALGEQDHTRTVFRGNF